MARLPAVVCRLADVLRLVFLVAGIGLFTLLVARLGPAAILEMLGRIGWHALPIAALYTAFQATRARALQASVLEPRQIRWRDALWIRFSGEAVQFLTASGPFLAEPTKAWLLKRRGLTGVEGFAATLTEYLIYMFVAALISVAAYGWLLADGVLAGATRTFAIIVIVTAAAFLATAAFAITTRTHLLGAALERLTRLPGLRTRLRPDMAAVHRTEDLLLAILHDRPARAGGIALLATASHLIHTVELYWILTALDLPVGVGTAFLIEGATKFVGLAFFFIPGQIGASEGVHALVFEVVGLPAAAGFTAPFVRRIRMVAVSGVGVFAMAKLTRGGRSRS
jgi:hypothetical protein